MQTIFKQGDQKKHRFSVGPKDFATFDEEAVHEVCSTFALAREIEWSTRLFVKDMLNAGEEGIGTKLNISHTAPAFNGETVEIIATFEEIADHEILCSFVAYVGKRKVAFGLTGQKILSKEKLKEVFEKHK